tara:strand:+ start:4968 stop:5825 length:858 start_codon:yes stop_codon:yes gene_type:complete
MSNGQLFKNALKKNKPLIIPGAINAYSAMLAEKAGHKAIYLSGSGVAAASYGIPDLGFTSLEDVLTDVKRITQSTQLPLLVDIDTGWSDTSTITKTIKEMENAECAAVHIEDQISAKRCGHRPNKKIVTVEKMLDRLKEAVDARQDKDFFIIARTDALASEGIDSAIERCFEYVRHGADGIFLEAVQSIDEYINFKNKLDIPLLANITEFGKTPLFKTSDLNNAGVDMVLYPLTAFRAMSKASETVYNSLFKEGTQENLLDIMQTREELYDVLNYYEYERKLDSN